MSTEVVLLIATLIVVFGAVSIFVRDVRMALHRASSAEGAPLPPGTSLVRGIVEAALPLIGVTLLVWLAWAAL